MDNVDAYYVRRLVDHVPSMLAYWDADLHCRFANQAYKTWFGLAPESMVGKHMRDVLGPRLFEQTQPYITGALEGGLEQTFERDLPESDGLPRRCIAKYLPDIVDGQVRGLVTHVMEISDLKRIEHALQASFAELAREQSLRAQLEQRATELDTLLAERSDMLDVLAHEVRQPLHNASAALQSAQAALASVDEQLATLRLERAQSVLTQVMASLDNTLAAAALLARTAPIEMEDTDIDTLVAVAVTDMAQSDRSRIVVERDTRLRTAAMDMSLMRLALRNLLSNALKYGAPDTQVLVKLHDSDDPLGLVIDVENAGAGISAGVLPTLFQRGARGAHHGAPIGLGLGLYIARRVMDLHGGRIALARNDGHGVTMRLLLPPAEN